MEAKPLRQRVIEAMNPVFTGERGRPETHLIHENERADTYPHARDYFLKLLDGRHEVTENAEKAERTCSNPEQKLIRATMAFLDFTKDGHGFLDKNPTAEDSRMLAAKIIPLVEKTEFTGIQNMHRMFIILAGKRKLGELMGVSELEAITELFGFKGEDENTSHVLTALDYLNHELKPAVTYAARERYGLPTEGTKPGPIRSWNEVLAPPKPQASRRPAGSPTRTKPEARTEQSGFLVRLFTGIFGKKGK